MNAVRHSAARSLSTFIFAVLRHMFGTPEVLKPRCERFHYQETAELDKCPHVSYQLHTQLLHLQAPSQFAIRTTCSDTSFLACHQRQVRALLFLVCLTSEECRRRRGSRRHKKSWVKSAGRTDRATSTAWMPGEVNLCLCKQRQIPHSNKGKEESQGVISAHPSQPLSEILHASSQLVVLPPYCCSPSRIRETFKRCSSRQKRNLPLSKPRREVGRTRCSK